jgi:chemotaxis protein histidine kinase CheA
MAVIGTEDPNDPNNPAGGTASPGGNVLGGSGGGSGFVGGGTGQGATTSTAPVSAGNTAAPSSSGHFTNLSQYLGANQGAAATTGHGVENVLNQSANNAADFGGKYNQSASKDITTGSQNLDVSQDTLGAIKSGTQNLDQGQLDKIQSGIAKIDPEIEAKIKAGAAGVDPTILASIAAGADASGTYKGPAAPAISYGGPTTFQTDYSGPASIDAGYKGPTQAAAENARYAGPAFGAWTGDTANYQGQALGAAQEATGKAGQANGGFSGVSSLLKSTYQQPQYTKGENNLDTFLVGGNEEARGAIQSGAANASQAQGKYDAINQALGNQISGAQAKAAATNKTYDDAINAAQATSKATGEAYNAAIKKAKEDTTAKTQYDADLAAAQAQVKGTQDTYNQAMTKATADSVAKKKAADEAAAQAAAKAAADKAAAIAAAPPINNNQTAAQAAGEQISNAANQNNTSKVINSALGGIPGAVGSVMQGKNPVGSSTVLGQVGAAAKSGYQTLSNALSTPSPSSVPAGKNILKKLKWG